MKTPGKVDRSHYVRFATPFQYCNTIFGGFAAACNRGMDPVVANTYACIRSIELIITAVDPKKDICFSDPVKVLEASFAPRGFGGWAFPTFGAF